MRVNVGATCRASAAQPTISQPPSGAMILKTTFLESVRAWWLFRAACALLALVSWGCLSSRWLHISAGAAPLITDEQIGAVRHWTKQSWNEASRSPGLLVLVLNNDETSWGVTHRGDSARTITSFLRLICETAYPARQISLGFLTSSRSEFIQFKSVAKNEAYSTCHAIHHPGYGVNVKRGDRHTEGTQRERRRSVARLRNYLMLRTLRNEQHVVWLDADVYWLTPGIIPKMIQHSQAKPGNVGMITARCVQGNNKDYDRNAWAGPRLTPTPAQATDHFVPQATIHTKFLEQLVSNTSEDDLVHLDSVGGTILYMAADMVRQGLTFPVYNAVGTLWDTREGWDGIETEGLCYIAKSLGFGCFGLGGGWHVKHTLF